MIYSDLYTGNKQGIPTIVGVLLVVFVSIFFLSLVNRSALPSKASQTVLKRTEVTNLNPIQANIYWQTQEKEVGWIVYGENKDRLSAIALDDRDVNDKKGSYFNHYVTLRNLESGTLYFYAIISSDKRLVRPDGNYFSFKTPTSISTLTKIDPASGKVLRANLTPLSNAVVLLTVNEKTVALSTLTKESGEWLVPLNSFFDKNTQQEIAFTGEEQATVEIISEDNQISTITNSLGGLSSNPETVIIGKNYNFLQGDNVLSATDFKNNTNSQRVQIIYPQEGALIPGRKPLIKGTALPLEKVSITINSVKTYSAVITADKSGSWSYLIPENLDLGKHVITAKTKGEQNKEVSLIRNFTIVANEGLEGKVLGTASGEPTITVQPTAKPTTYVYNTPTLAVILTSAPPVSGTTDLFPVISGLSLVIVGAGILLAF